MNKEKWENIKGDVLDKFEIFDNTTEDLIDMPGKQEIIVFQGPMGKMKMVMTIKPRVLDKKTSYSRRIGSDVKVDYVYSEDEFTHDLKAYKWDDNGNDWVEIEASNL